MHPYLELGSFRIPMYGLMAFIGILCALIVGYFIVYKKEQISEFTLKRLLICIAISGICAWAGAVFFDALFHSIDTGIIGIYGITYLGGVVTGIPVGIICIHKLVPVSKGRALYTVSLLIPLLVLGHAFGRIGCYFAGCCFGRPTTSWIGIVFPEGSPAARLYPAADGNSLPVIPTMLIEAGFEFLLFAFMMIFRRRIKGHELEIYLITYCVFRFIIEFYRGDSRGDTGLGISPAQLLDIVCIVCGVLIILFHKKIVFKKLYAKCEKWQSEYIEESKKVRSSYLPEERIKQLYQMMKDGIITEEEFKEQKEKLLNQI